MAASFRWTGHQSSHAYSYTYSGHLFVITLFVLDLLVAYCEKLFSESRLGESTESVNKQYSIFLIGWRTDAVGASCLNFGGSR